MRPAAQRTEPLILIRHEQLVGFHDRRARLVGLVVDVQPAQRPLVGELVLHFERVQLCLVDEEPGRARVRVAIFVLRHRTVDRLVGPELQDVESDLAHRRVVQRDGRVREKAVCRDRSGAGRRAPGVSGSATAPGVVKNHGGAADRRLREVAGSLISGRPDFLDAPRGS